VRQAAEDEQMPYGVALHAGIQLVGAPDFLGFEMMTLLLATWAR